MLRFGSSTTSRRKLTTRRPRWRLWMLFVAACVVLWCMRMLQRPEVSGRIDAVFLKPEPRAPLRSSGRLASGEGVINVESPSPEASAFGSDQGSEIAFQGNELVSPVDKPADARFDLSAVKDNIYFRSEENMAWFAIWDYLQGIAMNELIAEPLGEVTYAQLIDQPNVYRGKAVTIRGAAMREEILDAPENDIGVESYHRLIIRPAGGGVWPIVVYCLQLPPKFPEGDELRTEIEVSGIFFKNWSYSWQGGLGLAPVILANTFDWQPPAVVERPKAKITPESVLAIVAAASVLATIVGWFAWRQTRRPSAPIGERDVVISLPTEVDR